jgi:hypothetical protein
LSLTLALGCSFSFLALTLGCGSLLFLALTLGGGSLLFLALTLGCGSLLFLALTLGCGSLLFLALTLGCGSLLFLALTLGLPCLGLGIGLLLGGDRVSYFLCLRGGRSFCLGFGIGLLLGGDRVSYFLCLRGGFLLGGGFVSGFLLGGDRVSYFLCLRGGRSFCLGIDPRNSLTPRVETPVGSVNASITLLRGAHQSFVHVQTKQIICRVDVAIIQTIFAAIHGLIVESTSCVLIPRKSGTVESIRVPSPLLKYSALYPEPSGQRFVTVALVPDIPVSVYVQPSEERLVKPPPSLTEVMLQEPSG